MSWKASGTAKELKTGLHGEKLNIADKLVLMILSENYLEKKGHVWCSQDELSEQCLCTTRGLRKILERLQKFGLVGIVHRGRKGNYYSLPFMGNVVPQRIEKFEERQDRIEERIEERHVGLEEPARSSRTVDGRDRDSVAPSAPRTVLEADQEWRAYQDRLQRQDERLAAKAAKKNKWPQRGFRRETARVEEKPKRSSGAERAALAAERAKVLTSPDKVSARVRSLLSSGTAERGGMRNIQAWAKAPIPE